MGEITYNGNGSEIVHFVQTDDDGHLTYIT